MDNIRIPLSRRRTCSHCGTLVDSNGVGVFHLATGWIENRKKGGTNTIALPIHHDKYACHDCIDRLRHGIPVGQMMLFDRNGDD